MAFTPGQQRCIETLDQPLIVAAGAGSGKTFTLTQRIVGALKSGYVEDIDQVLAITYTNKAAREIKTRIVRELRANGMVEQSLKAQDAWISTIHGMCSRILRNHALELGINPQFQILGGSLEREIANRALVRTLSNLDHIVGTQAKEELLAEFSIRGGMFGHKNTIEAFVQQLMSVLSRQMHGRDIRIAGSVPTRRQTVEQMGQFLDTLKSIASDEKNSKSKENFLADLEDAREILEELREQDLDDLSPEEFFYALDRLTVSSGATFGQKDYKQSAKSIRKKMLETVAEAAYAHSRNLIGPLVKLALHANDLMEQEKQRLGLLSNDDVLSLTYKAMDDFPQIAREYQDRFKLVMVDEFQDTNQMQVDMISRLAGKHGERLCVVGDAQQSIYRFQGADVSVYQRHLLKMRLRGPKHVITLPDNFRSHHDVLAFVDRVFEQPHAFGRDFMSLKASRNQELCDSRFDRLPTRVEYLLCSKVKAEGKAPVQDPVEMAAEALAKRFARLHSMGYRQKDMVLLMGSTFHARTYAEAFRKEGLSCIIAKGSVFNKAAEVGLVTDLARCIVNLNDTQLLYQVLSSPLFCLSAEDCLTLVEPIRDDAGKTLPQNIAQGLQRVYLHRHEERFSQALQSAAVTLCRASGQIGKRPLHQIVADALCASGMLQRLESQGTEGAAIAANVLKALRMLESVEEANIAGPSTIANMFTQEVLASQEAPGNLVTENDDAVRIMTIHSSKGLEFPICAVAEYNRPSKISYLQCYERRGVVYLSLAPNRIKKGLKRVTEALRRETVNPLKVFDGDELENMIVRNSDAYSIARAMEQNTVSAENQEKLRLFYVAITRAKEMLIVVGQNDETKADSEGKVEFIDQLISNALAGPDSNLADTMASYDFGGWKPLRFTHLHTQPLQGMGIQAAYASSAAHGFQGQGSSREEFVIYKEDRFPPSYHVAPENPRDGLFSYSSISESFEDHDRLFELADKDEPSPLSDALTGLIDVADDDAEGSSGYIRRDKADADKATGLGSAFHRLAQYAALEWQRTGCLAMPPKERKDALIRSLQVTPTQQTRLDAALNRWFGSNVARTAERFQSLRPEVAFTVRICPPDALESTGGIAPAAMEGEIDLLCTNGNFNSALVIDYKTGGHPGEPADKLQKKHMLQAACYAYALLKQGYEQVDALFVRVEVPAANGQPQTVSFTFRRESMKELEATIWNAYAASPLAKH